MKIDFKLKELSKAGKFYIYLMYEGGDADTEHPEEYNLEGVTFDNWSSPESMIKIEKELDHLKKEQSFLNSYCTDNNIYNLAKEKYGEKFANSMDNVPNDPQADYQFKCRLSTVKLVYYNNKGDRYESYTNI